MTTNQQRVLVPNNPPELINLAVKVYARHCVMGATSPLLALQSNTWEENGSVVRTAVMLQELIDKNTCLAQECVLRRDELTIKIKASIEASHDLLSSIYSDNVSELSFWGFELDK